MCKQLSLVSLACACALSLSACGRGEGGASVGIGVGTDQTRSSGTSQGTEVSHSARVSTSDEVSTAISQSAARVINLAMQGSSDVRAAGLREILEGHNPLEAYADGAWPPANTPADVLAMAAAFANGSVEFWEVPPASLRSRTADGLGSRAERAYVETLDASACVVNAVGGALAEDLAHHKPVFVTPDDAVIYAKQQLRAIGQAKVQPLVARCTAEAHDRKRRLGQDTPRWTSQDYALTTGKGGIVVAANGTETWFGKGYYSGVQFDLRFARSNSFALDDSTSNRDSVNDEAKRSNSSSVSVGK